MPRLRLPRIGLASLRDRAPSDEHERLVLVAQIAGCLVVIGAVVTFVLIASANAGEGMAVRQPPIPTITDSSAPATTPTTTEPAPPPVSEVAAPATVGSQEAVVKPKPKPHPRPPKPAPTQPAPPAPPTTQPPDPGPPQTADPYGHCAPEGAQAFTKHRHIPLVCHDGRWHFADFGR
jgi:hypothetical protein